MLTTEDYALGMLVSRLREIPPERLGQWRTEAMKRGTTLAETIVADHALAPEEVEAARNAAAYLVSGGHLWACASCRVQIVGPPRARGSCRRCRRALVAAVLPAPAAVEFEPELERQVRGLFMESLARLRTVKKVAHTSRLRSEGKVGKRAEAQLAPADRSCTESMLGHYKLQALVGRGSSAYVYRAEDTRDARTVALKVLYFRDDETEEQKQKKLARFQREAELAGKLEHPHLLTVGPLEQAGPWRFFPMTFIDGPSLSQVLETRGIPTESAVAPKEARLAGGPSLVRTGVDLRGLVSALCDIARALHYAHSQGVIHRDVTPRNILFSSSGQAYLSDFGIARAVEVASALTGREVLGTLTYAAPERLRSEAAADARSDVYSLGVVLLEILTGPVSLSELAAETLPTTLADRMVPDRIGLAPEVTAAFAAVVRGTLTADPAKRFQSALEFAEAAADCWEPDQARGKRAAAGLSTAMSPTRAAALLVTGAILGLLVGAVKTGRADQAERDRQAQLVREVGAAHAAMLGGGAGDAAYLDARQAFADALRAAEGEVPGARATLAYWRGRLAWAHADLRTAERRFAGAYESAEFGLRARTGRALSAWLLADGLGDGPRAKAYRETARAACEDVRTRGAGTWDEGFAAALLLRVQREKLDYGTDLARLDEQDPQRIEARVALAHLIVRRGAGKLGIRLLEKEARRDPFLRLYQAKSQFQAYRATENGPGAALSAALALGKWWPELGGVMLLEAEARLAAGEADQAAALARAVREEGMNARDALELEAAALEKTGRVHEAVGALGRLAEMAPERAEEVLYRRGQLLAGGGYGKCVQDAMRAYLQRFPAGKYAEAARASVDDSR